MTGPTLANVLPESVSTVGRPLDLVVVGDVGIDFMVAVDAMPGPDQKAIGRHLGVFGGGMAANFSAAARAAAPQLGVGLVSRVGDDPLGAACLDDLRSRGLDVSQVHVQLDGMTWWCAVALDSSGEKALLGGRTSASLPLTEDFDPRLGGQARWLHVLGDAPVAEHVLDAAASGGAVASVDIEASFVAADVARARRLAGSADVVVTNRNGLVGLSGHDDVHEGARALLTRGSRMVLTTLGAQGARLSTDDAGAWDVAARPVARVVDTTGAGDSFAGTFTAHLLTGDAVMAALTAAASASAHTVTHHGARTGELLGSTRATS